MENISVIGIGKLGLAFGLTLEKAGYSVRGVDVNEEYVQALNDKTFVSEEPGVTEYLTQATNFEATTKLQEAVLHSDLLFIIVATPSLSNGRYDHSQVDNLITALEALPRHGQHKHFIVCCTTMPGYCEAITPRLKNLNYTVSYNPEFIAQGTILKNQEQPDMVLIGEGSEAAGDMLQAVYETHTTNSPRICRMTPTEAELTKLSLNCFLTTKIAYANMIGDIALRSSCDPATILNAIGSDSRIGNKYLGYGFGYGGPCFPRDNRALALHAGDCGVEALISKASDESNALHLEYQVEQYIKENAPNVPVQLDYVTYKRDSTLLVESQQLEFAKKLAEKGYNIIIKERRTVIDELKSLYGDLFTYVETT
jgi:nucleotide sugar dehydrogenase